MAANEKADVVIAGADASGSVFAAVLAKAGKIAGPGIFPTSSAPLRPTLYSCAIAAWRGKSGGKLGGGGGIGVRGITPPPPYRARGGY